MIRVTTVALVTCLMTCTSPVKAPAPVPQSVSPPTTSVTAAVVVAKPTRGSQVQVVPTIPPPTTTFPTPVDGDCSSWRRVFVQRGATAEEAAFFFDDGIIERETGCGRDYINDQTGDSGICQINPIHNRPGWFGGREFGDGGWLMALHGLKTRVGVDSVVWADACLTLYRVCGTGPWRPPYSCANNRLDNK